MGGLTHARITHAKFHSQLVSIKSLCDYTHSFKKIKNQDISLVMKFMTYWSPSFQGQPKNIKEIMAQELLFQPFRKAHKVSNIFPNLRKSDPMELPGIELSVELSIYTPWN